MSTHKRPTLTDAKGMGGLVAQHGFDYQVWDALIRLPAWLRNPAFECMAVEVLEDLEARFFAPHAPHGHLLERFQAKLATLARAELVEVFESFAAFEAAHPRTARLHTLVTPALPATFAWLARDPDRVRRARPFYGPFADIRRASDEKLREDLTKEFGKRLGDSFGDSIEVGLRTLPDRAHAEAAFAAAMQEAFPDIDVTARKMQAAFGTLNDLVAQSRGAMLTRSRLLAVLGETLETQLIPDGRLRLHVRSDRNGTMPDALEIDASGFSGASGGYPEPERWRVDLLVPLETTARWALEHQQQRIALSGSYRLSTAFAFGYTFRSASGFEIDIPTRSESWRTNEYPAPDAPASPWEIIQPQGLVADRLVVGIGVLRDPLRDIQQNLAGADHARVLMATLAQALTSGADAQASIQVVKAAVVQAVARLRPAGIDLFYVGPAAFAVALGHHWNALPPTRLHEFLVTEQRYRPTALLA